MSFTWVWTYLAPAPLHTLTSRKISICCSWLITLYSFISSPYCWARGRWKLPLFYSRKTGWRGRTPGSEGIHPQIRKVRTLWIKGFPCHFYLAPIVGHVGDGNFHCVLPLDMGCEEEVRKAKDFIDRLAR